MMNTLLCTMEMTRRQLPHFPTYAGFCYKSRTLRTRSRVTQTGGKVNKRLIMTLQMRQTDKKSKVGNLNTFSDSHVAGVIAIKAAPFLATHVATAVRNLTALPLWIRHFACQKQNKVCFFLKLSTLMTMPIIILINKNNNNINNNTLSQWNSA